MMKRLTLRFSGPIERSLWSRFRKRSLLGTTAAASAVVVYSLISVEPNLSGVWVDAPSGTYAVEIYQMGKDVRGHFLWGGAPSFRARHVSGRRFEGQINLFWNDRMTSVCGSHFAEVAPDYAMVVDEDFESISTTYTSSYHSEADCTFQYLEKQTVRLVRRGY